MAKKRAKIRGSEQKAGRGSPPKHTQFPKGKSGNPAGRPKGSKNFSTIIMEAASDHVTATVDGKKRKISKIQATAMQLATRAASGNQAAMGKFLDLFDEIETRAAAIKPIEFPLTALDLEVIYDVHARVKLCNPDNPGENNGTLPG